MSSSSGGGSSVAEDKDSLLIDGVAVVSRSSLAPPTAQLNLNPNHIEYALTSAMVHH